MRSLEVAEFLVQENDGDVRRFEPVFTSVSNPTLWRVTFEVPSGETRFDIFGVDASGDILYTASITVTVTGEVFIRGDANGDRRLDVSDVVATLLALFAGRPVPCPDAGDTDDSGVLNLTDVMRLLGYLFKGGEPLASPFPGPGVDPTEDGLGCLVSE